MDARGEVEDHKRLEDSPHLKLKVDRQHVTRSSNQRLVKTSGSRRSNLDALSLHPYTSHQDEIKLVEQRQELSYFYKSYLN